MTGYITCIDCGKEVERTSGTQKRCAACRRDAQRATKRRWAKKNYADNPERMRDRSAKFRADNRELVREYSRNYYYEEHERLRKLRVLNRDAIAERTRAWEQENPELVRRRRQRRDERAKAIDANRSRCPWTPAEDALVMSWTEGLRELGAALERSEYAVTLRRRRLRKRAAEQSASSEGVES